MGIIIKKEKWYALYKGDKFLCQGTRKVLAEYLGVEEKTIYFYTTNAYKKRFKEDNDRYLVIEVV